MGKLDWLKQRSKGIHLTIRDIDCRDFNVEGFIKGLTEMDVEFFSFFAGGYVTTYPSNLKYQRISPYLNGRDLTGEIVEEAHKYGIKAIAMIDLGQFSKAAALAHPDWCSYDSDHEPYKINEELYISCPLGGYPRNYAKKIVNEITTNYDVDGIKFGGGSYGFKNVCYCENCRNKFYEDTGYEIPKEKDWENSIWRKYVKWRFTIVVELVNNLKKIVKAADPELLFMGNAVCFGNPGWITRSSLDMDKIAKTQDAVQIEAQTRVRLSNDLDQAHWESLTFPGEEARYLTNVSNKPIWIVVSYFVGPWRRSSVPYHEQKVYLAQIAANGASPMVNLSGGPMAVHEDKRGFRAIKELYNFIEEHKYYYNYDSSGANIAILFSLDTLIFYGKDDPMNRYVESIRGIEQALQEEHIPFDIISTSDFHLATLQKYKSLILPTLACLDEKDAEVIKEFLKQGGGLVSTFETSLFDNEGLKRRNFLLKDILGASYSETVGPTSGEVKGTVLQSYMRKNTTHPIFTGLGETDVIPEGGSFCLVQADNYTLRPMTFFPSFPVYPEGIAYSEQDNSDIPLCVISELKDGGRSVYFPNQIGKQYWKMQYPDLKTLITNSVQWTSGGDIPVKVYAPSTLDISYRLKDNMKLIHLVNLTGGRRFFDELIPLYNIKIGIKDKAQQIQRAYLLSNNEELTITFQNQYASVIVPKLIDYDVVVFE